ncbi:MAG TPA: metal ABC transporter permease [Actinocrinis sp.]|jgi:zinc/manganese transport system permease protein
MSDMFAPFMTDTWITASIIAVIAALVGFFVVLRGAAFTAHAVPNAAFAGAAGASLLGVSTLLGLGVFSLGGALGIGLLSRRGRHDAVTALIVALMLGLGALFLSWSTEYAPEIYSLLFGEVLGVSAGEVAVTAVLAAVCLAVLAAVYRPLLLTSTLPEVAEARGVRAHRIDLLFLSLVALATTTAVPVVGALLMFSLMVGPPAAARALAKHPAPAMALSVVLALATVWGAIALSFQTNWSPGFFVGVGAAAWYLIARLAAAVTLRQVGRLERR